MYVCDTCGKTFNNEKSCSEHEIRHEQEKIEREKYNEEKKSCEKNLEQAFATYQKALSEYNKKYNNFNTADWIDNILNRF